MARGKKIANLIAYQGIFMKVVRKINDTNDA